MTACSNSRRHGAVVAALVGAMSLGAPAVALAANGGIEVLALSAKDAFAQGTMTAARDANNKKLDIPADGIVTVEKGNKVVPAEITPKDGKAVDLRNDENVTISYSLNGASVTTFDVPGTYEVKVEKKVGTETWTFTTKFIVEDSADLSNATIFDDKGGVSDTTFTYNGVNQIGDIRFAVNGKELKTDGTDYIVKFYEYDPTNTYADGPVTEVKDAGTYVANLFNPDETVFSADNLEKQIVFTVGKLNLSSADLSVADVLLSDAQVNGPKTVSEVSVDGGTLTASDVDIVSTVPSNSTGKASALVSATGSNVTGSKTVEFNVVKSLVTDVRYNGTKVPETVNVNAADGESFRPERIEVFDASGEALDSSYYTVSYEDADGNAVEASALANPGKYTVTVRVNAEASHFEYGSGDLTFKVNVTGGTVTASDIVFKYDGEVGTSFKDTYTGEDFLPQIETIVHTKWGDDLVAGTDYTVVAKNEDGEEVDKIVDAGEYEVSIDLKGNYGSSINADDLKCAFEVEPMSLTAGMYVSGGDLVDYTWLDKTVTPATYKTQWYLGYTGEAIEPSFELGYYTDEDGNVVAYDAAKADDLTWNALPSDAYTVTGYKFDKKDVDEVKDKGEYEVQFALETGNYEIPAGTDDEYTANAFTVSDKNVGFADVQAGKWYSSAVFTAKQLGYIKGIQGSNLYAPENSITRADALVIISRMAGFDAQYGDNEDYLDENIGYVTRYSDVDPNAYYAQAIAWGTKVGVVNGDTGASTFRPTDTITRQEFAAMLMNYAKVSGKYVAVDASEVLAGFPDGSDVSAWAADAVAWAASNEVMGNGGSLTPRSDISRAEVAAMAVNYQPEGISSDFIG